MLPNPAKDRLRRRVGVDLEGGLPAVLVVPLLTDLEEPVLGNQVREAVLAGRIVARTVRTSGS